MKLKSIAGFVSLFFISCSVYSADLVNTQYSSSPDKIYSLREKFMLAA